MYLRIRNIERRRTRRGSTGRKIKIRRKSRRIVGNLRKEYILLRKKCFVYAHALHKGIRRSLSKFDIKTRTSHTVYSMGEKLLNRILNNVRGATGGGGGGGPKKKPPPQTQTGKINSPL
jgi:hypothetical protein